MIILIQAAILKAPEVDGKAAVAVNNETLENGMTIKQTKVGQQILTDIYKMFVLIINTLLSPAGT